MAIENDILTHLPANQAAQAERLAQLMPPQPEAAELTVRCGRGDFLASAIARAVEDCDAHLINLNVTSGRHTDGSLLVHLRINRRNPESVARSLRRYGFDVVDGDARSADIDSTVADNANYLLRLINV